MGQDQVRDLPDAEAKRLTPKCPCCGAKFSHSIATDSCLKCGIPDEVVAMGHRYIARWRNQHMPKKPRAGSKTKRTAKHGRKGVKR